MEGLPQSENSNYLEKRGNRKRRKSAEFKVPIFGPDSNEQLPQPDVEEHKEVWHRLVSSELDNKPKESASESAEKPRRTPTEAHSIHGGLHPEAIGQVLITAAEAQNPSAPAAEQARTLSIDRHVETMSREDLFELSSKIVVEGSTLLHMYETHLIGEKALRRLVAEHLGGGNLHEALRAEIIEHEIDFERDPNMRDTSHQQTENDSVNDQEIDSDQNYLNNESDDSEEAFNYKANLRADNKAQPYKPQVYHSRALDIGLASIIIVLLVLVLILAFTR
jgi:hypothetical protein